MRNGSHRFWLCIAAAVAVSAIAIPAASAGVHKYDTRLGITDEGGCCLYHGGVKSDRDRDRAYHPANAVRKCMEGRRVILFEQRPGADRMLGTARSHFKPRLGQGYWQHNLPRYHRAVYAEVTRKVGERFVCRADRSGIKRVHRSLAVATAAAIPALGASIGKGSGGPGVESGIRIAAGSPHFHGHIMANQNKDCIRVERKVRDRYVCRADHAAFGQGFH